MSRIHEKKTVLKLSEFYEKSVGVSSPYYVSRLEKNSGEIVWFGLETNWRFFDGQWYVLKHMEWEPCEEPEYEKIYEQDSKLA